MAARYLWGDDMGHSDDYIESVLKLRDQMTPEEKRKKDERDWLVGDQWWMERGNGRLAFDSQDGDDPPGEQEPNYIEEGYEPGVNPVVSEDDMLDMAGVFVEPFDWINTFKTWSKEGFSGWDLLGLLPLVPHAMAKAMREFSQYSKLSKGEIRAMKKANIDIHELKGKRRTGQIDLYKDKDGNIVIMGKGGKGEPAETGYNIKEILKEK
jgi:hypothetical protein